VQVGGYGNSSGDGNALHCTIGTVPVNGEKYSTSASTDYSSKTSLVTDTSPATVTMNIPAGASSTGTIYWGAGLPSSGVGSSCSGHVVFTPVNH
jgi:hypothetical protein